MAISTAMTQTFLNKGGKEEKKQRRNSKGVQDAAQSADRPGQMWGGGKRRASNLFNSHRS